MMMREMEMQGGDKEKKKASLMLNNLLRFMVIAFSQLWTNDPRLTARHFDIWEQAKKKSSKRGAILNECLPTY